MPQSKSYDHLSSVPPRPILPLHSLNTIPAPPLRSLYTWASEQLVEGNHVANADCYYLCFSLNWVVADTRPFLSFVMSSPILFSNLELSPFPTCMDSSLLADSTLTSCSNHPSLFHPPLYLPLPATLTHLPSLPPGSEHGDPFSCLQVTSSWYLWPYLFSPSLDFSVSFIAISSCIFCLSFYSWKIT